MYINEQTRKAVAAIVTTISVNTEELGPDAIRLLSFTVDLAMGFTDNHYAEDTEYLLFRLREEGADTYTVELAKRALEGVQK